MTVPPITDTERFLARIEQRGPAQCWWWSGAISPQNYPRMKLSNGSQQAVARFAWEMVYLRGPIPAGYVITRREHDWEPCPDPSTCIHRLCLNPDHMVLVRHADLHAELMRTVVAVTRTVCRKRGHPLTEDNVIWISRARNKRVCRICHTDYLARRALG